MATWPSGSGVQNQTAGTYTWTAPAGVTKLTVQLWGGGASGGEGFRVGPDIGSGQGGGGGEYRSSVLTNIVPGNTYTIVIGAGGSASDGNSSTWQTTVIVANPGLANGTGGSGGTGTTGHNGGDGANLTQSSTPGGGGGGSGGTSAAGNTPSGQTGATAVTGGGNGGNGGNSNTVGSAPTTAPGGGGGGGGTPTSNGTKVGGAGKAGAGTLTWPTVFTVTFNANGGTGSMASQSNNQAAAINSNTFTRTGYYFSGWNTAANGSGTAYANGASYPFTASTTLYAQWAQYTVTFNANGGTGSSTQNYYGTTSLTAESGMGITRAGYSFDHWNTAANDSGTTYADGANYNFAANATLYAIWVIATANGSTLMMMGVG